MSPSRRTVLRAIVGAGAMAVVSSCGSPFAGTRLTLATGGTQGVYYRIGNALADVWRDELGLGARPEVLATNGSVDNLALLASGATDVVISQVDTVDEQVQRVPAADPRAPRALARIYDDVVHVVVPATSPAAALTDLRGMRVSVGAPGGGVSGIASRLLAAAGLSVDDLQGVQLGINESVAAMLAGEIDAFFWSGGLPTDGVDELAAALPIRLLDLSGDGVLAAVRSEYPVYATGTVPAQSYGIPEPITTLLVRNFLLVDAAMPDALAKALVKAMFAAQGRLVQASRAALTIDPRAAIGTQPVLLHPGAQQFYREEQR